MMTTRYSKASVDGLNVFYREAGPVDAPVVLLLHGFPSAGHMFRKSDPDAFGSLSADRAGPARLRPVRHAASRQVLLHVRKTG